MPTTTHYSVRPSRLFYFLDGDTIVTCRDRSYRVHSAPLARYSCVMRKALTMGRLPRLWRDLRQDNEGKLLKESGDCVKKRRVGGGARARARDIRYLVTLDDSVQSVDLLFWCIYECRYGIVFSFGMIFTPDLTLSLSGKPRMSPEIIAPLLHLGTDYAIPTLLPLCITYLESLALFHPLKAIPTIRLLIHHRKTTSTGAEILQPLYSEALSTILNDLPYYQEEQREEYTRVLPDELRAAFADTWARYVERMDRQRSGEGLFAGLTYTHSRQCMSDVGCEEETREQLWSTWEQLWGTCRGAVPRPCEVSKFFMTAARAEPEEKNNTCRMQVRQALGWILRGLEGEDALWNWRFLSVESASLRMAKELAIRPRVGRERWEA
ncbi:hypothetical protein Q9L58_000462 [Maublancomyces gigas]|uniref:BTB domain-containing protein n=1 Tax=Discina gigas TaxID=1032678 RepID=A0ABR3GWZ9_9PEZI